MVGEEHIKVLSDYESEKIKEWAEKLVRQWHDEIKPDYVFVTDTGAVPHGYVLKEAWKRAYGKENTPRFYRINPRYFNRYSLPTGEDSQELINLKEDKILSGFVNGRIKKQNPRIIVLDEGNRQRHGLKAITKLVDNGKIVGRFDWNGWNLNHAETEEDLENVKKLKIPYETFAREDPAIIQSSSGIAGRLLYWGLSENLRKSSEIWVSRQVAQDEIINDSYNSSLVGKDYILQESTLGRKPTVKKRGLDYGEHNGLRAQTVSKRNAGEQRVKDSLAYVKELKLMGQEAGENLRADLERQQSLEQRASASVAIVGLLGSLFFTSSTFTGNVIGSLTQNSTNLIGVILFLVGIVASFFYVRKSKHL